MRKKAIAYILINVIAALVLLTVIDIFSTNTNIFVFNKQADKTFSHDSESLITEQQEYQVALNEKNEQIANLQEELNNSQVIIVDLTETIDGLNTTIAEQQESINKQEETISESNQLIEELEKNIQNAENIISELEEQLENAQNIDVNLKEKLEKQEKEIEKLKEEIEGYKAQIIKVEEKLEEQKNNTNNQETEEKGQEKVIEEKQAKIEYLTNRISKQEITIKMLEKQLEERWAMYERLKGLVDQTNATPDQLLYGRIAYSMGGLITGTMPNRLAGTGTTASKGSYTPSTSTTNGYETTTTTAMTTNNTTLTLGLNDTLTLPYGFYSKGITVRNGVVNRGKLTGSMLLSLAKTGGYKGYYDSTDIPVNNTIIASSYTGANNETAPTSTTYNQDSGNTINLGVSQKLTIPTGYYHKGLTINNGVINRGTVNTTLNAGQTYTSKAGYYSAITVKANSLSSQTPATATAAQILSGYTAWVNGEKITGIMPYIGTYTYPRNGEVGYNDTYNWVHLPEGYYTTGSTDWAPEVRLNDSHVIELARSNPRIYKGTINAILTSESNTQSFPAGYYDAFTVSTNITSMPGTISYVYHHHTLGTVGDRDNNTTGGNIYDDSYESETSGGCFTMPYYHLVYKEEGMCLGHISKSYDEGDDCNRYRCDKCGKSYGHSSKDENWEHDLNTPYGCNNIITNNYDRWTTDATDHPDKRVETKYLRSCGKISDQIISATVTY